MTDLSFTQLVDIGQVRQLLEAHYRFTGILSAILDTDENVLVAVGWQDICTRFHRAHPVACARCRESDARVKKHLHDLGGDYLDYRCENGLREVAVPIIINGKHLATLFTGQFFYDDEKPDMDFFRAQAEEFGFDTESYLAAVGRVPVCSREQIRNIMDYYCQLVKVMAESGLKNLRLTREVAERKQAELALEGSRDYLAKIINSIADPIFVKDREHRLVLVNDAECTLAGSRREELIGRTDYDFFPREQVDIFWQKDEIVFETGQENINEEEITDALGRKRIILTKKSLFTDLLGDRYIVGIIRDITGLKETEVALRRLNEELESRVEARTSELAALNETLEKRVAEEIAINRAKDMLLIQQNRQAALGEMLDHIAHQWKQPINAIGLIVQDLESSWSRGEMTADSVREAVHKTMGLLRHMSQTIAVFRDFYQPDKKRTVFRIGDAIDTTLAFIMPSLTFEAICVACEVDPGLSAVGYHKEYTQVLLNILGNARNALIDRKTADPLITIKAFDERGKAVVTVTDNAGGIPEMVIGKIFDPYVTTRKERGGTGIGLYMSKNIIEKNMGGALSVANVQDGAQFRIEIPMS
jgi:PAS domain S-box-containing protein